MTATWRHRMPRRVHAAIAGVLFLVACENYLIEPRDESQQRAHAIHLASTSYTLPDADTARVVVTLLDARGEPLGSVPAGTTLHWSTSDTTIVDVTNDGLLHARFPGTADVTVEAVQGGSALTATAEVKVLQVPTAIGVVAGDMQTGTVASVLEDSIAVVVTDRHGTGVPDVTVSFVPGAGGRVSVAEAITDADGGARTRWTLGNAPGEQTLEVAAGGMEVVLRADALAGAAASVEVTPASRTLQIGESVQLHVLVSDTFGNPLDAVVTWSSSDTAVARVDSTGLVRAVAAGAAEIAAEAAGARGVARIDVMALPNTPPSATILQPADGASFTEGTTVPLEGTGADAEDGALSGDALVWSVDGVEVGRGARIDWTAAMIGAHTIALVARDSDGAADTARIGIEVTAPPLLCTDTVTLGAGASMQGELPSVRVTGAVTVVGPTNVCGSLTIAPNGELSIGGQTVDVAEDFTTLGSGRLRMQDAGGVLRVGGDALFQGGSTAGLLTAGRIQVAGDFTQRRGSSGCCNLYPQSFQASGSHAVELNGTGTQRVEFENAGFAPDASRFNVLLVRNPDAVHTGAAAAMVVDVGAATAVTGPGPLAVRGGFSAIAGSSITPARVRLEGQLMAAGVFSPDTVWFDGARQTIPGAHAYQHVIVRDTVSFAGDAALKGSLTVAERGVLDIGAHTVEVATTLTTVDIGRLAMRDAAGLLIVHGDAVFGGGDTNGLLSSGTLRVGGAFEQRRGSSGCCNLYPRSFHASGSHTVILSGAQDQEVSFATPSRGSDGSRFRKLRIENPGNVTLRTPVMVVDTFELTNQGRVAGPGPLDVGMAVVSDAATRLVVDRVVLRGAATAIAGVFAPDTVFFEGETQTMQAGLLYQNVVVRGQSLLDIGDRAIDVAGSFRVEGLGRLQMQDSAGRLRVAGDFYIGGRETNGLLTAGSLEVMGDFVQRRGSSGCCNLYPRSFQPSGAHRVVMRGSSPQLIDFGHGGMASDRSRFATLVIAPDADVSFTGTPAVTGSLDLFGTARVAEPLTLPIGATLVLRSTAVLHNTGSIQVDTCERYTGYTIIGTDPCAPLGDPAWIQTPLTDSITVGASYGRVFEAGGSGPLTFTSVGAPLPPGLTLNAATGELSGWPEPAALVGGMAGEWHDIVIRVSNGFSSAETKPFSIIIVGMPLPAPYAYVPYDKGILEDFFGGGGFATGRVDPMVPGAVGEAMRVLGPESNVRYPVLYSERLNGMTGVTVAMAISTLSSEGMMFNLANDSECYTRAYLELENGAVQFGGRSMNPGVEPYRSVTGRTRVNDGAFHSIVGVLNLRAARIELFVDGLLDAEATQEFAAPWFEVIKPADTNLVGHYGCLADSSSGPNVAYDELAIWDGALNAGQTATIAWLLQRGVPLRDWIELAPPVF